MVRYGGFNFDLWNPSQWIESEWFIFTVVFLITFTVSYLALARYFTKKEGLSLTDLLKGKKEKEVVAFRGPLVAIAICIALITSSASVRYQWALQYFGASVMAFVFFAMGIVLLLLFIPFYKALEKSVKYPLIAVPLSLLLFLWAGIKYLIPYEAIWQIGDNSWELHNLLLYIKEDASAFVVVLVIGLILGGVRTLLKKKP
jgi:hypothetical protein